MSSDTVARLADIPNIIGVKDATGDLGVAKSLTDKCANDFILLSGDDGTAIDFIMMGGHGGISVTANVVPNLIANAYDFAIRGNNDKAKEIDITISDLHSHLFIESNPIPVKWAIHKMGYCGSGIRLPLTVLSKNSKQIIESDLLKHGLIK
jgi:4-hydroxy-tetrahydrodipicolinate synthase